MKAAILTIGDEILNGQTVDTNASWIAQRLNEIGIDVSIKLSVSDQHEEIIHGLQVTTDHADIVLTTGGLGPTKDDITKVALADFLGTDVVFSQPLYDHICAYFAGRGREVLPAHRAQSVVPDGADLLDNPRGTALGMWMSHGDKIILSMPGVPSEMKSIMTGTALDRIAALVPDQHIIHHIIQTSGTGETVLAEKIDDIVESMPAGLSMAYLPTTAAVKLRLTGRGTDPTMLESQVKEYAAKIESRVQEHIYAIGDVSIAQALQELCIDLGVTVGVAESCTGGGVSNALVNVSGSSAYYQGSVVSYSNELKQKLLGVSAETLRDNGAVSGQCVEQMVRGAVDLLGVDCAVAISGIAGPTGGTPQKPVGTIWIGVGNADKQISHLVRYKKDREMNMLYAITSAIHFLRLFVKDNY